MLGVTRREIVSRRVEYILKSPTDGGELSKAWRAAEAEYRRQHLIAADAQPYDDWVKVEARDDEIVLSFVVDKVAGHG